MYEDYQPSERIFVDRKEYLEWMADALERCKKESVVLHLRGIGGIGKSSLIDYWSNSIERCIPLDCSRVGEFYDRLDVITKGALRLGIKLRRFEILWHVRQRFIKGVEPAKDHVQGYVMDIVSVIPFVGDLAQAGRAISAAKELLRVKLTGKLGDVAKWLQTRLGKEYMQRLLEVLWKKPSHAEFLYLDALLEDLNSRKNIEQPIVVMLDGFEEVDNETLRWRHCGRMISEAELWYVFLSSLTNCVGVVASRRSPPRKISKKKMVEKFELTELDEESCRELLGKREISREDLQTKIISVSGGNPFVMSCICDIQDAGGLSMEEVEDLGAETLEQVRVKTWRRLFRRTDGLIDIIDRAGLVPFIDRHVMDIIAPSMKSAHWDQLIRLSFIRNRGDGTWVLHDLARELVLAELGDKLEPLTNDVADFLEAAAIEQSDTTLSGIALSVRALAAEPEVIGTIEAVVDEFIVSNQYSNAISLLNSVTLSTDEGKAALQRLKGTVYAELDRVTEAEQSFRDALRLYRTLTAAKPDSSDFIFNIAKILSKLGGLLRRLDRPSEAEAAYWESIALYRERADTNPEYCLENMAKTLCSLALLLLSRHRESEAEEAVRESLELYGELAALVSDPDVHLTGNAYTLILSGRLLNLQDRLSEAEQAYQSAIEIYRGLAEKAPDVHLKRVGRTLHRLAYILLRKHNLEDAEEAVQEELSIFRNLAKKAPLVYQKDIARALSAIGYLLFCMGKASEAEEKLQDALNLFRDLAEKAPRAYLDSVANRLNDLGRLFRETRRYDDAEKVFREALELFKELAEEAPEVYSLGECASCQVGITLQELGHLLWMTDRLPEAEEAYLEAIRISREIARNIPHHRHMFLVSRMLHDYAILLRSTKRVSEAEEVLREALTIYRELSEKAPEAYWHVVASALNNLAILLRHTNRIAEAEKTLKEALEIYRKLSKETPELFMHHYGSTLNNHAILLRESGKLVKAEKALQEALEINRKLAEKAPELHLPRVSMSLNNLAFLLMQADRMLEAEKAIREAVNVKETLAQRAPRFNRAQIAVSLNNLGIVLSETNRPEEAEKAFLDVLELRKDLADREPESYLNGVASVLNNLGILFRQTNRPLEAEQAYREAIKIWGELAEGNAEVFEKYLGKALSNLHILVSETNDDAAAAKDILDQLLQLGITDAFPSEEWSEEEEDDEVWFHEIFYHWSDCPFCV